MTTTANPEFEALLGYLKDARGFDFSGYKRASLMRRINHRMAAVGISAYLEYVDYLEVHPEEFAILFDTILINVTGFFRDPDAWVQLRENVLPNLLEDRSAEPLRVWSPGCSSGEEAYSLAIALAQQMGVDQFRRHVKIYATDVDEEALAQARSAAYTARQLKGLSDELVEEFFEAQGDKRVFRKDLRRSVIFGRNDLVQDAPISRIDLLVCRNTLIYLNAETQSRILGRLHFAMRPRGVLFLGKAEMLLSHSRLFTPIDLKRRFFTKVVDDPSAERANGQQSRWVAADDGHGAARLVEQAVLATPLAQVVVDDENLLAVANRAAQAMFGLTERDRGRAFYELEMSYRPVELRTLIAQVTAERRALWVHDVIWSRSPTDQLILDVHLVPLQEADGTVLGVSITFQDVSRYSHLQDELEHANRQLETAYEELQSTNEELETTNEELQSTNEELETMNEELHSMNDELQVSNEELRARTEDVGALNSFMESILTSLRAGIAVLDADMHVLIWNRRAEDLWGVRQDEAVGKHLLALDIGLPVEQLRPLVRSALAASDADSVDEVVLPAVNRRGRQVMIRVRGSRLPDSADDGSRIILTMEQQQPTDQQP